MLVRVLAIALSLATCAADASGCAVLKSTVRDLDVTQGVFPVEDYKDEFSHEFTTREGGAPCAEGNKKLKWCPEPQQEPYLDPSSSVFASLKPYLTSALEGVDRSLPLVFAILQMDTSLEGAALASSSKTLQVLNFVCGWERLGLLENRSVIFATTEQTAGELRRMNPQLRVLYHPDFDTAVSLVSEKTKLNYVNRVWKLTTSQLLLNMGYDALLTDVDVYFVRDPMPMLHKFANDTGMEFAAMQDLCWLTLNSGFMYFRNTEKTRRLLQIALTTERDPELCGDNDQYLFNCGIARAAMEGLDFRVLPNTDFAFGSQPKIGGYLQCHNGSAALEFKARWLGDGMPYIWHTSGFSGTYDREMDMFSALNAVDVNQTSGKCLPSPRGTDDDARKFAELSARSCSTAEDGILHAGCFGDCMKAPERAQKMQQRLSEALATPVPRALADPGAGRVAPRVGFSMVYI